MQRLIYELPEGFIAVTDAAFLGYIKRYGTAISTLFENTFLKGVGQCWVANYTKISDRISEHMLSPEPEF